MPARFAPNWSVPGARQMPKIAEDGTSNVASHRRASRFGGVGKASAPGTSSYSATRRNRSAFAMTDTDDRLIAAAAIIGDSKVPVSG